MPKDILKEKSFETFRENVEEAASIDHETAHKIPARVLAIFLELYYFKDLKTIIARADTSDEKVSSVHEQFQRHAKPNPSTDTLDS
ncbi:hypothetical protein PsorP6_017172 [Peronosclerospora sorghi]|uniref:Uncharacterized protein n=1 Tax=Peronosclerospora sorghi TaxID=230839 RepID=A0ACC0WGY4_9STRA|nr:hypothetical protein PsorP6_017172 [Peronosclerospora sorghi]